MNEVVVLPDVPEFTIDDYKFTDKPYSWLYSKRNDKFLLRRLSNQLRDQAGDLGFKGFVGMFKAYCESMASRAGEPVDNNTDFPGQPMSLACGRYTCNEDGVTILDRFGYEVVVCPHPIMPTRRLVNVDSDEEKIEISYKKGASWRKIIADKTTVSSSSKILDLAAYGIFVNSENAKSLSTFLFEIENLNYDRIPERRSISRLGWINNHGFSPYLDDLDFDGDVAYRHIFNSVREGGSHDEWLGAMRKLRAEKKAGRVFLAASFASAILEPCGLLPFFVHLWGGQGVGKTVSLMIAASVWANPRPGEYIMSFNSTDVGQEMTASFLNSMPLCMDELQIQVSSGQQDFDKVLYKLTEGFGKIRGAKTGGLKKTATWKNCILTTGEHPILKANSMDGASVRVVEIECAEPVYSDLVGLCDVITKNYGTAGRLFVDFLQLEGVAEEVNHIQKGYYRELLDYAEAKQAAAASAILAADAVATKLLFRDENHLTVEDIKKYLVPKGQINSNRNALDYIQELVYRNQSKFSASMPDSKSFELWGKVENGYIYVVKSVFDRELTAAGFNPVSFLSWAARTGLLLSDKNRKTKKVRFGSITVNTVCIRNPGNIQNDDSEKIDDLPI